MTTTGMNHTVIALLLLLNSSPSLAIDEVLPEVITVEQETNYKNKTYHFSFSVPAGWEKQSGNANSDNVLFMQMPISNSCSFQFNIIPMSASFPAEAAVNASLAAAYHELKSNRLISVKRRDSLLTEKLKEKDHEKEKIVILTRGWEITETAQEQKQQRIIYQVYDLHNHYFNFVAAATSEKFPACESDLRKIMNSISFINLEENRLNTKLKK